MPIKQVGPNQRKGWIFGANFINKYSQVPIKQVGPNKRVGWVF